MEISVIVPVSNGALTVKELTKQLSQVPPTLTDHYDLILVEDAGAAQLGYYFTAY